MNKKTRSVSDDSTRLYTDGACIGNPGPGGWAYMLYKPGADEPIEGFGGETRTTNNRMELTAVIMGLSELPVGARVVLTSDSSYVVNGLKEWMHKWQRFGWKKTANAPERILNADLWEEVYDLYVSRKVDARWVRGHVGHPQNERCDQLATDEAKRQARGEGTPSGRPGRREGRGTLWGE